MKRTGMRAVGLGLIGLTTLGAMEQPTGADLAIDQVPGPVQAAIAREAAGQEVRWVQKDVVGGRTVYVARVKQDGLDQRLMIGEDGTLVGSPDWGGTSSGVAAEDAALTLESLPSAVRATLERQAHGQELRSIERDLEDGRSVYHARIRQDGLDKRVSVGEDGALLGVMDWKDEAAAVRDAGDRVGDRAREAGDDLGDRADGVGDGVDQGALTIEQAPLPVQETLRREAGDQPIADLERGEHDGAMAYRARVQQDGIDKRLTIAPDGRILEKSDWTEENAKANQAWQTTKEKSKEAWESTKEGSKEAWGKTKDASSRAWDKAHDWVQGDKLTLEHLPAPARAAIEREANGREIRDVDHELEDGAHFYEAKIHVPDGEDVHVKVDEDGKLIEKKH